MFTGPEGDVEGEGKEERRAIIRCKMRKDETTEKRYCWKLLVKGRGNDKIRGIRWLSKTLDYAMYIHRARIANRLPRTTGS